MAVNTHVDWTTMPTFADALKREIARVARKEVKADMSKIRHALTAQRGEIAALKREVKSLKSECRTFAKAQRQVVRPGGAIASKSGRSDGVTREESSSRRGRRPVFSAQGLKETRTRLGLTQVQLARLMEVSSLSVSKWESGGSVPRSAQQEKIFALRTLGKRAASKILEERTSG